MAGTHTRSPRRLRWAQRRPWRVTLSGMAWRYGPEALMVTAALAVVLVALVLVLV